MRRVGIWICLAMVLGVGPGVAPGRADEAAVRARPRIVAPPELRKLLDQELGDQPRPVQTWMRDGYRTVRDRGWWWARLRWQDAVLELRPGPQATLQSIEVRGPSPDVAARFLDAAELREGTVIASSSWEGRLREGLSALGNEGYPFASVGLVSLAADSTDGGVDLVLALYLERRRRVAAVEVRGASHTRGEVLARLSGIRLGSWYEQRAVDEAEQRWTQRGLVEEVTDIAVHPEALGDSEDAVAVDLAVRQKKSFGRAAAALGVLRDAQGDSRVSGEVDVTLLDLFGTAREFQGRWSDDGVQRRRLQLEFLEPLAFGLPFDLRFRLATQHEDDLYDRVDLGSTAQFLGGGGRRLEVHAQFERSTFVGQSGRVRWRRRLGATLGVQGERPVRRGFYGSLVSRVDAAQVSERIAIGEVNETALRSTTQTLVDTHLAGAFAWSRAMAWELRAHWSSTEGAQLPLPRGEQWTLGGARTVRGYREEQFHGERLGYGGAEWLLGPQGSGQAYLFSDLGWIRETLDTDLGPEQREHWLFGFGVGLRSPTRAGALDLSIGFAERVSLDNGKLHLALTQEF